MVTLWYTLLQVVVLSSFAQSTIKTIETPRNRLAFEQPTTSNNKEEHLIVPRSFSPYSPVIPNHNYPPTANPSYDNLAALTYAALAHQTRGAHLTSQSTFRSKQPLSPIYHATPIQPFGALLQTSGDYDVKNTFVKPIVEKQQEARYLPQLVVQSSARSAGSSVGKITEAILHKPSITKHAPVVYRKQSGVAAVPYVSDKSATQYGQEEDSSSNYADKYKFGYQVRDPKGGNYFGHSEVRDGHSTKGHYHVFLPDGRLQNVEYWVDLSGYHATISYDHPATHKQPHH